MKTTVLFFAMILGLTASNAGDDKYIETMTRTIDLVYKASTTGEFLQSINTFDRIGNSEKNKWEPFYYSAFGYTVLASREADAVKKDGYLDQAIVAIQKASAITADESEIVAMEGFISMIRLTVDPATRGQQFAGKAMQSFEKAVSLNPENPRALGLLAQMQFGTARFFKASTQEACENSRKALEKFATYVSANRLAPVWGKGMVEESLKECQ